MHPRKYTNVMRFMAEQPWAILPSKLDAIIELVSLRADGHRFSDEEIAARIDDNSASRQASTAPPTIAVLPLYGSLVPRADMFTKISGATSMEEFGHVFQAAVDNPQIGAILIDVDSPGGTVAGTPELAAIIREARGTKPIVAIANTYATSGAYWIASQADEVVATPSAMLGSIGVLSVHESLAGALDQAGVAVTIVKAGKFKAEANPWQPLSDEARAHMQELVGEKYDKFVSDVALARGISVEKVKSDYGEGRTVTADMALKAGAVDRIATFEETIVRLLAQIEIQDRNATFGERPLTSRAMNMIAGFEETVELLENKTFADDRKSVIIAATDLVNRTRSIVESPRGRLATTAREEIAADADALSGAAAQLRDLLAGTDTDKQKHSEVVLNEIVQFEALRADI